MASPLHKYHAVVWFVFFLYQYQVYPLENVFIYIWGKENKELFELFCITRRNNRFMWDAFEILDVSNEGRKMNFMFLLEFYIDPPWMKYFIHVMVYFIFDIFNFMICYGQLRYLWILIWISLVWVVFFCCWLLIFYVWIYKN